MCTITRRSLSTPAARRSSLEAKHQRTKPSPAGPKADPDTNEGRKQLAERAKVEEEKRDLALAAYHHHKVSSGAVQIAIVLASSSPYAYLLI